jgi:hypothetical protein
MLAEGVVAVLVGLAALLLVMQPLLRRDRRPAPPPEPLDPEETPRGVALSALKEIDFDRETGKLSESDYQLLKAKYTGLALEALRDEERSAGADPVEALIAARVRALRAPDAQASSTLTCRTCGLRPEPDAIFCSTCGVRLQPIAAESADVPLPVGRVIPSPSAPLRAGSARNRPV